MQLLGTGVPLCQTVNTQMLPLNNSNVLQAGFIAVTQVLNLQIDLQFLSTRLAACSDSVEYPDLLTPSTPAVPNAAVWSVQHRSDLTHHLKFLTFGRSGAQERKSARM